MKLEVGMYVRTTGDAYEPSKIGKIKEVDITSFKEVCYRIDSCGKHILIPESFIKKASFNLIDLIEVGDYVNGQQVIYNDNEQEYGYFQVDDRPFIEATFYILNGTIIKSILTHEQYNANKYVVGSE